MLVNPCARVSVSVCGSVRDSDSVRVRACVCVCVCLCAYVSLVPDSAAKENPAQQGKCSNTLSRERKTSATQAASRGLKSSEALEGHIRYNQE